MVVVLPHPSHRRRWLVWGVAVAAYLIAVANRTSLSSVGVTASERFEVDASILSLFAVVQLLVYGAMQIPVGVLLDRFGARPIITIGMVLMAGGQVLIAFSPDVGVALGARMLLGAGDAAIFPSVIRVIATWFPAQRSPLMVQLTGVIGQTGQLVSVIPLAALLALTSWTVAFASLGALTLLFAVLVAAIVASRPPDAGPRDVTVNTGTGTVRTVTSTIDTSVGIRAAWSHPGTRLAFWSHFTAPFAGTTFVMLWGIPFLTVGEGLSPAAAAVVMTVFVVVAMLLGPVMGIVSARIPLRRSRALVLPTIALQAAVWAIVLVWPGPAPFWILVVLAIALGTGGPASMIAFDHARTHNPSHRISTANGITNVGGFVAALLAILAIGVALDLQGAGNPVNYSLEAFRVAFLTQLPLWALGALFIVIERRKTRIRMGLDAPRRR